MIMNSFLESAVKQFQYYKMLGDKTFVQLSEKQLLRQDSELENSVAVIVNHLWGNMLSRWTDFRTTDGEKDFRDRDQEFEQVIASKEEMLRKWEEGWSCLFATLGELKPDEMEELVYIRNQGHTITEAINRQLCHYAYHVGQIVLLGKINLKDNWKSLSIPKGKSKTYNKEKFAQDKKRGHFSDEYIKKETK